MYSEVPIHPYLAPHVQLIWTLDVDDAASFGSAERILPDGIVEAVFHYRSPFVMRYRCAAFGRQPPSLVVRRHGALSRSNQPDREDLFPCGSFHGARVTFSPSR